MRVREEKDILNIVDFRFRRLYSLDRLELYRQVFEVRCVLKISSFVLQIASALIGLEVDREPANNRMLRFHLDESGFILNDLYCMLLFRNRQHVQELKLRFFDIFQGVSIVNLGLAFAFKDIK